MLLALSPQVVLKADAQSTLMESDAATGSIDQKWKCDPFVDPGCNTSPTPGPKGCTDCNPSILDFESFRLEEGLIIFDQQLGSDQGHHHVMEQIEPQVQMFEYRPIY